MSNINWKLRLQNKVTLLAIITQAVAIVYMILGMIGIVPAVGEDAVTSLAFMIVELLALLGIVVDPTTEGVGDSRQAQCYAAPRKGEEVADLIAQEKREQEGIATHTDKEE